jgi:cell division protein ZipA
MAELRWILLLAGLLFLAGLTAWEMRRPRQGRRDTLDASGRSEPELGAMTGMGETVVTHHEPPATSMPAYAYEARVPLEAPVHVDLPPLEPPLVMSFDEPVLTHEPPLPTLAPLRARPSDRADGTRAEPSYADTDADVGAVPLLAQVPSAPAALPAAEPVVLIVEWPPEQQRHVLSVRVVGVSPDRMSGRPLRQALAACGFVHGRFGIFHQPGADGRALISAANLSKPGVFDPASMDFQRFRGLGLFAVLPGPLPPAAALDHLLDTAGDLAQRLQARVQDEHGMPLDEERLEEMARVVHGMSHGALRQEPAA